MGAAVALLMLLTYQIEGTVIWKRTTLNNQRLKTRMVPAFCITLLCLWQFYCFLLSCLPRTNNNEKLRRRLSFLNLTKIMSLSGRATLRAASTKACITTPVLERDTSLQTAQTVQRRGASVSLQTATYQPSAKTVCMTLQAPLSKVSPSTRLLLDPRRKIFRNTANGRLSSLLQKIWGTSIQPLMYINAPVRHVEYALIGRGMYHLLPRRHLLRLARCFHLKTV
mmetsp:Transcript_124824/g.186492  ORF Transcript_124824/g.186492 Transcript_124824/m.186492 type:complete len:224 (+) Transcript_124824:267-938(+)